MKEISVLIAIGVSVALPLNAQQNLPRIYKSGDTARKGSLVPGIAAGTAARTFVSFSGLDTNACSRTSPCRSFGAALAQTASGGTAVALDSAGYGTMAIGQSVSIVAPAGVYAGIAATSGIAIDITGTSVSDIIHLRGLSIEGSGSGSDGIYLFADSLKELHVEHCTITGFTDRGINFELVTNTASLFVADTTISDSSIGLYAYGNPGVNPHMSADHCRFTGNSNKGLWIDQATGTITNSVVSGNGTGLFAQFQAGILTGDQCQIENNTTGVAVSNSSTIYLSNSTITDNGTGLSSSLANLLSLIGDGTYPVKTNIVVNNGTNGSFTGTFNAQ